MYFHSLVRQPKRQLPPRKRPEGSSDPPSTGSTPDTMPPTPLEALGCKAHCPTDLPAATRTLCPPPVRKVRDMSPVPCCASQLRALSFPRSLPLRLFAANCNLALAVRPSTPPPRRCTPVATGVPRVTLLRAGCILPEARTRRSCLPVPGL